MYSPYSDQHGSMSVAEDTVVQWATIEDEESRNAAFQDFVLSVGHPFEFWGMIFERCGDNFEHLFPDFKRLILDLMTQNASRWELDEVVCFFLEIIDEHPSLSDKGMSCLMLLSNVDKKQLMHASNILFEMLNQDYRHEVVNILYESDSWKLAIEELIQQIAESNFSGENKEIFVDAAIEILRKGVLVNPYLYPAILVEGYKLSDQRQYFESIEKYTQFYFVCPDVLSDKVSLQVAICFMQLEWKGEALHWATIALSHNPDMQAAKDLQHKITSPYSGYLQKIKTEHALPHWTSECADIFATTDLQFRMQGRIMMDYGGIINGFGRTVETQLKQKLLPKVRQWINEYGKCKDRKGYYCKNSKSDTIYANDLDDRITLGFWIRLLNDENGYQKVDREGEFFYCATRFSNGMWGSYEWALKLSEYGKILNEFAEMRNKGSHGSFDEWVNVVKMRNLCLMILEGIPIKDGNLIG